MEPRVLNCIENDPIEVTKTPRTRRSKKNGDENMTPPSDTTPNKSFFKANHLETLQPVKQIINGEAIHFSLPDGNAKLSDEIPFVDVSYVASDLFLTINNLERLKNVKRLVAEGRISLPRTLKDEKFIRAYPYVYVGQQGTSLKVKKRVSFSNMDIEINEFSITTRLKLESPHTRGVLKKPSVFRDFVEPKKKAKPKIGPASKMKVWRSEMKNTGVKLKLTKRKVSIDSPGEEKLRRNSLDGEHLRGRRAKTKPVETITISDDEAEGSGRKRRARVNQTSETMPTPPPIRTKAALKMLTPETGVILISEKKKPPYTKKKRGKKSVNGKKKKMAQIKKTKPVAVQHKSKKKKGKGMPFKFRLAKNFKYSDFSCDKCNNIFKKNIDLQQHLLKHIKPEKLVINITRIAKDVLDKKLKKDVEVPLQEFKRLSLNSEDEDIRTSANILEVETESPNTAEESLEVDKITEIKDVSVAETNSSDTLSDENLNLGEVRNLQGEVENLQGVDEVNTNTNNVIETSTENDCDENEESNIKKVDEFIEDKIYENGISEKDSEEERQEEVAAEEDISCNKDNEQVGLNEEEELSRTQDTSLEQPDAIEVISKIETDLQELCFRKSDEDDRAQDVLSNEDLINILVDTDVPGKRKRCKSILIDGRKDSVECDTPKAKRVRFATEKIVMCDDNSISKENIDEDELRETKVSGETLSDNTLLNDVEQLMQEDTLELE